MGDRAITEDGDCRCPWHDTLVENFGKSGKNGRLGNTEKLSKANRIDVDKLRAEQAKTNVRIALITSGGSLVGSGLMALLVKVLG